MKYLSVCSGIEAASVAWHPLGWSPVAFAEIEKFPSAVLAHHYPSVPNLGDITKFKDWPDANVNVLVGGTPCQSFSVAGLRKGLADPRGNLALTYLAILDRYQPEWCVWENVPGVLSSGDGRDFGAFLGGLAELGYHGSYRVLDAQYVRVDGFGRAVPQRRRRVFVVGNSGDWRRAAAVLFERESLSGNPAPRREAGQGTAVDVAPCFRAGGNATGGNRPYGTDVDTCDSLIASTGDVSHCLNAGGMGRIDYETETMIAFDTYNQTINGDVSQTLCSRGDTPGGNAHLVPAIAFAENSRAELRLCGGDGAVSAQLTTGGGKPGQGQPCIAFDARQSDVIQYGDKTGPLDTNGHTMAIQQGWAVRRLTPRECERLQGFPDGYTDVPWRNKNWTPDGPRYKALGNSMAVNAMRWLGRRIEMVSTL